MNQGTLQPGQTISVNKYDVQVERYLSQGGFAHVYLVRTAITVYNTTRHVLKRIAVPNEIMLNDVKKEVDIMRILRGHPNIVHLIDAAWHKMADGVYEVFILMEFCPGGGIIDMMNRRLRERLTEAEILQIFVDVCEGVAAMHNLRPALLHRDLKVENILQASQTSFKLCDFGSSTPVALKPPSNSQELRALEADLNRHTTLQYRAPEMVDVFSRRPIDEKSDVWALGVLLYKLCYYTTPFEEHGPLAILNVQYRIPPYPVYSPQMNALIASMLQEHGSHRPSVFEILRSVHRLRGTTSSFTYNTQPIQIPTLDNNTHPMRGPSNVESVVLLRPRSSNVQIATSPSVGGLAREKGLETITPMRRGRPESDQSRPTSRGSSPKKLQANTSPSTNEASGIVAKALPVTSNLLGSDAWAIRGEVSAPSSSQPVNGFENDFSTIGIDKSLAQRSPDKPVTQLTKPRPPLVTSKSAKATIDIPRIQDAFDGLGLSSSAKAPTLGEARLLRTGLSSSGGMTRPPPILNSKDTHISRPVSSSGLQPSSQSPSPLHKSTSNTWEKRSIDSPVEARFPSLEELDASFSPLRVPSAVLSPRDPDSSRRPLRPRMNSSTESRPRRQSTFDGTRSQQVTGAAMRDSQSSRDVLDAPSTRPTHTLRPDRSQPPSLSRRHRSSASLKQQSSIDESFVFSSSHDVSPGEWERGTDEAKFTKQPDWLTGDDDSTPQSMERGIFNDSNDKQLSTLQVMDQKSRFSQETKVGGLASMPSAQSVRAPEAPVSASPSSSAKIPRERRKSLLQISDHRSSSSEGDDGPEDASGNRHRAIAVRTRAPDHQQRKHTGRQSSVHDLVDKWGGKVTRDTGRGASAVMGVKQFTTGSNVTAVRSQMVSLSPPTSKHSVSNFQNGDSIRDPRVPPHQSQPGVNSPLNDLASDAPPPDTSWRPRPQSMFIFPGQGTAVELKVDPKETDPKEGSIAVQGLQKPHEDFTRRTRKASISDMVQRYEAIGEQFRPSDKSPVTVANPQNLRNANAIKHKNPIMSHNSTSNEKARVDVFPNFEEISQLDSARQRFPAADFPARDQTPVLTAHSPMTQSTHGRLVTQDKDASDEPDPPYQGVASLIQRWQQQTTANDGNEPKARRSLPPRPAGIANASR